MKVQEFMEKHGIGESRVRISDVELGDEVYGIYEMGLYRDCEVVRAYPHNGDTVLEVASVNG
jgi:hypothetical protein